MLQSQPHRNNSMRVACLVVIALSTRQAAGGRRTISVDPGTSVGVGWVVNGVAGGIGATDTDGDGKITVRIPNQDQVTAVAVCKTVDGKKVCNPAYTPPSVPLSLLEPIDVPVGRDASGNVRIVTIVNLQILRQTGNTLPTGSIINVNNGTTALSNAVTFHDGVGLDPNDQVAAIQLLDSSFATGLPPFTGGVLILAPDQMVAEAGVPALSPMALFALIGVLACAAILKMLGPRSG